MIRTAADRHRFVLTNHHIVLDGWSLPILLGEMFAGYYGQRLPAAVPYRRFVSWLAGRDLEAARAAWREVLAGFDTPTLVGPPGRLGLGPRGVASFRVSEETTRAAWRAGALVSHHRQHRAAGRLRAAADVADRPARCRLRRRGLGAAGRGGRRGIDGGPVDQHGAGAGDASRATTTTADLLDQLQRAHNQTLEHEHLALSEIHRVTGHDQLFDTLFVYENYPIDTAALSGADGLAITEFTNREYNHYPLTMQAVPGSELGLRVEYRHRRVRRGRHRGADRAVRAGVGGDDRRPDPAVVVDGCARCR